MELVLRNRPAARLIGGILAAAVLLAPLAAAAAGITLDLKVERKPLVFFKGQPKPAHELIAAMSRPHIGLTTSALRIEDTSYAYRFAGEADGRIRLDSGSLRLAEDAVIRARIAIRYPRLSDAQFNALRNTKDYRLVYGYIRGIVEHEQEHAAEATRFAKGLRPLYAKPPVGEDPVITPRNGELPRAAIARFLSDRLQEGYLKRKRASDAVQKKIDDQGKVTRVEFRFQDPIDDVLPQPAAVETRGKLRVKFEVPKGNPRPPEPKTKY